MKQRLITGIVAGALFLGLCVLGNWPYQLLLTAMAFIGFYEFVKMIGIPALSGSTVLGYAAILSFMIPWNLLGISAPLSWEQGIWILLLLFLLVTVFTKNKLDIRVTALLFTGIVYIGMGFSYMAMARASDDGHGLFWTFYSSSAFGVVMPGLTLLEEAWGRTNFGQPSVPTKRWKVQ